MVRSLSIASRFVFKNTIVEFPRFINRSKSLQIVSHYSTVNFICHIYGVPVPIVTWYKVSEKNRQVIKDEDLELLLVNSRQYV